ncbi:MAG: hypothetical protein IKI60_01855 [Alloprevotella sp.]|nr:hypothetical protein [Alloprevotella sp.]
MKTKTYKIYRGRLMQEPGGVLFIGDDSRKIFFERVRVHVGKFFIPRETAFQISGHIFISRHWLKRGFSLETFAHEYGHYLQQRRLGFFPYLFRVAIPSVWSLLLNPVAHVTKRYERHATLIGKRYAHLS